MSFELPAEFNLPSRESYASYWPGLAKASNMLGIHWPPNKLDVVPWQLRELWVAVSHLIYREISARLPDGL